jgi:hypothetical protein
MNQNPFSNSLNPSAKSDLAPKIWYKEEVPHRIPQISEKIEQIKNKDNAKFLYIKDEILRNKEPIFY